MSISPLFELSVADFAIGWQKFPVLRPLAFAPDNAESETAQPFASDN
jgi:hypothetical protein